MPITPALQKKITDKCGGHVSAPKAYSAVFGAMEVGHSDQ